MEVKGANFLLSVMLYAVLLTRWCPSALSRVNLLSLSSVMKEATLKKAVYFNTDPQRTSILLCWQSRDMDRWPNTAVAFSLACSGGSHTLFNETSGS